MTDPTAVAVTDARPRLITLPSMADVEREEVEWLWYPRVPRGKFTLLEGDPGLGKSLLTCALAAILSRGWPLPGEDKTQRREPRRTLLLADEDGYGDTVRPRLEALGADLHFVRPVLGIVRDSGEHPLTLDEGGVMALSDEVETYRPALIVIDPLFSYIGAGADINKGTEVRAVLRPLVELCQRSGAAMIALRHFTKMNGASAIYRGQGNIDFLAAARSVLAVREDPDNAGRAILCHTKSNLGPKAESLAYRIGNGNGGVEFLWEGQVDMSVEDLFAHQDEDRSALDEAKQFLHDALFEGPKPGKEVQREAREAGVAERTLWRAKSRLGVKAKKEGAGGWFWVLPLQEVADKAGKAVFQSPSQKPTLPLMPSLPRAAENEEFEF